MTKDTVNPGGDTSLPLSDLTAERQLFGGRPVIDFKDEEQRRGFLRAAVLVGFGSTLVAASRYDRTAAADATANDLEILNYALTLEYLESDFYDQGVEGNILDGDAEELVTPIRDHEGTHVSALTKVVKDAGGKPAARPKFKYPSGTFDDQGTFLKTASVFEELGVTAYHGQVARIDSGAYLSTAAAIAGVESRHAAVIAHLIGGNPFPASFEKRADMKTVLAAAGDFIES